MCDMQKMPTREDASCEEDSEMNFAAFSPVGATGTHFVTTGGQLPVTKIQQNVSNNSTTLQQVMGMVGGVSMGDGVQYVRTLEGGASLQATPQLISVPISLPGAKPGDPQPTVQIQVLSPNLTLQQQQPKYQMQIPIQGFQQGGAVITVAYSPEANEAGGIQLVGQSGLNGLPEGLQVLAALPQEMQLVQSQAQADVKEQTPQNIPPQQMFITHGNNQIVISNPEDSKSLNNNNQPTNNNNPGITNIIIKEECDDNMNDDESSQGTETSDSMSWQLPPGGHSNLIKYLHTLPPQQAQALPVSLQQFLRLNPTDNKKIEIEVTPLTEDNKEDNNAEENISEDGLLVVQNKKKKKYKKKPPRPARPKPGQVVIATAADGTPIYCCPECHMAYPEKEHLEMHLICHKIERRFICGICGAGLKRKEHLERHKLGHNPERPYVCGVCRKGFKRREHLNLHTAIHSGVKTELCGECGKGFYRKDHLRKHTRSHETKRARTEANASTDTSTVNIASMADITTADVKPNIAISNVTSLANNDNNTGIMREITIHVPTSANMQVPVQINIPQHVVSTLQQQQQQQQQQQTQMDTQAQLDALLAQHT